ncbi:30 kDa heat shock protein [Exophiala dermatitidis]
MALFPRLSTSFGPSRQELGPFFNLFNDTFSELQKLSESASRTFAPKFDVKEAQDKYILEGELPGIDQKNVTIQFEDDQTLTIKGRTEHHREEGQRPDQTSGDQQGQQQGTSSSKEVATTGSKEVARSEPKHTYWVSERQVGEFARSFAFPNPVDQDNVKASLKNGILSVIVPKLEKSKGSKQIQITSE